MIQKVEAWNYVGAQVMPPVVLFLFMLDAKKLQEMLQVATYIVAFTAPVLLLQEKELIISGNYNATITSRAGVN